jgi:uncharacterized membrane protein
VHPFDLTTVFLARHAQHVVLIHFPVALLLAGVAFDAAASRTRRPELAAAAYWNLAVAAFATLPAIATGLLAWRFQLAGQRLKGVLLLHLVLAGVSTLAIWLTWWVHRRARRAPPQALPGWRWPLELAAAALVATAAHLGGFLSGVNLPQ